MRVELKGKVGEMMSHIPFGYTIQNGDIPFKTAGLSLMKRKQLRLRNYLRLIFPGFL